jgi:hypothetical protein
MVAPKTTGPPAAPGVGIDPQECGRQHSILRHGIETARHLNDGGIHESGRRQKYSDGGQRFAGGPEGRARQRRGRQLGLRDAADPEHMCIGQVQQ